MELEGEWVNDIINGKCRIKWKSGNFFDVKLENNKMNGNGYMVWKNKNEKYTGMWKDNLQNGYGIHIWYDSKNENKYLFLTTKFVILSKKVYKNENKTICICYSVDIIYE